MKQLDPGHIYVCRETQRDREKQREGRGERGEGPEHDYID
jgi:glutamyl/glutaminyl-tRNA synthetase